MDHGIEIFATFVFALAVFHTFLVKQFQHLALKYPEGSIAENLLHLLGEVEVVFGLWAAVLLSGMLFWIGPKEAINYVESLNFTEPAFVFVIMAMAATRPVVSFAEALISTIARFIPLSRQGSLYLSCLAVGPLLGSFITEPASMTISALLLKEHFFDRGLSPKVMYVTLGVLFVNVSIGGVLTSFAAPPVLMVASPWGWNMKFMISNFGWKAIIAVILNASLATAFVYKNLTSQAPSPLSTQKQNAPHWLTAIHLAFLALVVVTAHHPIIFIGLFLFFLGTATITKEYQEELKLKESLLVAFFLGGLVVLGGLQRWWLAPIITNLSELPLFLGATFLTAFTDNAALTYLGAQVPGLANELKYGLVAGAVAGGGLTVIANAPNPAGFAILKEGFGPEGISPIQLALSALVPTMIAMACLWFL